ncbi:MAG: hypothetical protein ACKON9_19005, partial [Planctomycetaceae bacterium]
GQYSLHNHGCNIEIPDTPKKPNLFSPLNGQIRQDISDFFVHQSRTASNASRQHVVSPTASNEPDNTSADKPTAAVVTTTTAHQGCWMDSGTVSGLC